jgi:hypothetical protein
VYALATIARPVVRRRKNQNGRNEIVVDLNFDVTDDDQATWASLGKIGITIDNGQLKLIFIYFLCRTKVTPTRTIAKNYTTHIS